MPDPTTAPNTRLTKSDLQAIKVRVEQEIDALGPVPTMDSLNAGGYHESATLHRVVDGISNTGRVLTLLTAEFIQAGAALVIATVFGLLEYWRVFNGAQALGQSPEQSSLIAFAVVTANVVHPIYALRAARREQTRHITTFTLRGLLASGWHRIGGKPTTQTVDWSHNPGLHLAAMTITLTTLILAVFDLIQPILVQVFAPEQLTVAPQPTAILLIQLVIGLGLSLSGVIFLQAAAHEIGTRTLTDKPTRLTDILAEKRGEYDRQVLDIRQQVTDEHRAGKIDDAKRKQQLNGYHPQAEVVPFGESKQGG